MVERVINTTNKWNLSENKILKLGNIWYKFIKERFDDPFYSVFLESVEGKELETIELEENNKNQIIKKNLEAFIYNLNSNSIIISGIYPIQKGMEFKEILLEEIFDGFLLEDIEEFLIYPEKTGKKIVLNGEDLEKEIDFKNYKYIVVFKEIIPGGYSKSYHIYNNLNNLNY